MEDSENTVSLPSKVPVPQLWSWLRDLAETLLLAILLYAGINALTGRYQVINVSMQPTLYEGQYLIVSKLSYRLRDPARGEIVVLEPPPGQSDDTPLIKRIVGLPGDHVEARNGRIWVNGVVLNEPYVSGPVAYTDSWVVGADEYFVLGDNRNSSSDSHNWGTITREALIGKAVFRYWPFNEFGPFTRPTFAALEAHP